MTAKLSTHVLDNHQGKPASGVPWILESKDDFGMWRQIGSGVTNSNGRTDSPLLSGDALQTGRYRIVFNIKDYYLALGVPLSDPPFLDEIPLEVNLISGESYHVPLVMTPWSYSTYRGS
ncbi:hydroxyisourate hydrolase [Pelagicoccus albus]|uniref:5-hydroxyisourate hydrolase n=1 Tax=Pelagicoccus albus TaxID=415222 RepID=A0A7X1B4F1_9BACT|nr:hydroxyisourate hydrolase [Pelagicoccus albus]MBC2605442.1 hydroxyisourate hydrolase [Pelagicoccus albus]